MPGTEVVPHRGRETAGAALASVVSNSALTVSKLVVGYMTGSISVISEGVHSGNDLVAALLAFFSVRKANQPADVHHGYGHGKFEALSGLIEAVLIVVAALAILYSAAKSFATGTFEKIEHGPALAVMAVSMVLNIIVSRHLYKVARRHDSIALQADAAHLSTDVWTSAGVFVGLGIMSALHFVGIEAHWLDPGLAFFVGALVTAQGWNIARQAVDQLLDASLPPAELERIGAVIRDHYGRYVSFHRLRSRRSGHQRHIDLHLVMCQHVTVGEAHEFTDHLETEIQEMFPGSEVMIHVEPCTRGDCGKPDEQGGWELCRTQAERSQHASPNGDNAGVSEA
jgi:cation diffusion facilitator family transporter